LSSGLLDQFREAPVFRTIWANRLRAAMPVDFETLMLPRTASLFHGINRSIVQSLTSRPQIKRQPRVMNPYALATVVLVLPHKLQFKQPFERFVNRAAFLAESRSV
jgi:hypothetical protein